ncbi:F-box protein [Spatholobus suberectus]|nr:F-box protein [Spatholobus suberectus]
MFIAQANQRNPSLILHCDSPIVNKLCYISSEEGSNNYSSKVLKIVPPFMSNMPEYQILTIGTRAWRSLGSIHWRLDHRPSEAFVNGALHWVTRRYETRRGPHIGIVAFELGDEKFKKIGRPMPRCFQFSSCKLKSANNIPAGLNRGARPKSRIWKHRTLSKGVIKVICVLKNGDILLSYEEGALVLYSPHNGGFEELVFSGLPRWFSAITHVETLFSVVEALGT